MQGTRHDEDALLLNKKNATNWVLGISKPYIKYELYQIRGKIYCKNKILGIDVGQAGYFYFGLNTKENGCKEEF